MAEEEEEFRSLRPHCLLLASRPTPAALATLRLAVEGSEVARLGRLEEHLTFPALLYLKGPTLATNFTISMLDYLAALYSRIPLTDLFIVRDLLGSCLALVGKGQGEVGREQGEVEEDLILAVLATLKVRRVVL